MNNLLLNTGLSLTGCLAVMAMAFGAAAIRGLTGFGMAIILVPLLCLVMRPDAAVILAILLQFMIGPVGIRKIMGDAHFESALPIMVAAMVTVPLGLWLLAHTPPDLARVGVAMVAIGAFLLILVPRKPVANSGRFATIITGALAGILTGFAAMPGPPVVIFYLRDSIAPVTARASMMLIFFATAIVGTAIAGISGLLSSPIIITAFIMLIPMIAGNWLGAQAFGRVSAPLWRSAVGLLLGGAGVAALYRLIA